MAANYVRCPRDRRESVKRGTPPFTKRKPRIGTCRRAPQARKEVSIPEPGAAGSRVPRLPATPAPGSPCRSRRTSEARATDGWESGPPTPSHSRSGVSVPLSPHFGSRREAPGFFRTGPRLDSGSSIGTGRDSWPRPGNAWWVNSLWWNPGERRERPVLPVGARRPADKAREGGIPGVLRPKRNAGHQFSRWGGEAKWFSRNASPLERRLGFATGC